MDRPAHSTIVLKAVMRVINEHADKTGKKAMFAFNITGDLDQMRRRHDLVRDLGGTCIMASLNSVGLVGMIELARHTELPIHAHRNGWGYLTRHPMLGWSYVAWQKIWRLAGADHMHVNGLANKFCEDDASVLASARACLTPLFPDKPCVAMPVFSSGQTVNQAPGTYDGLGSPDLIYAAGGGILAHPAGPSGRRGKSQTSLGGSHGRHSSRQARGKQAGTCACTGGLLRMSDRKDPQLPDGPLLTWYGDDFTGAAATMEVMSFAGLPAVLFFDIPTDAQLARFANYRGIGIAGVARSKTPDWMDANLPDIYRSLAAVGAPLAHYKFCSTLDSSDAIGSIGHAAELAVPILGGVWHPFLVAAPKLQRYQIFGNLFAAVDGVAYRLDRHPTMSRHPVTPMTEADVRLHLAKQTSMPIGLVDYIALSSQDVRMTRFSPRLLMAMRLSL